MNDNEVSENYYGIKFIRKIGQGAFSTVYEAYDLLNLELIAVKFWKTKDSVYLVTELMKAGSLRQFINYRKKSQNQISEDEASQVMKFVLSGVDYMHSKNIIHRDLKPENILMKDFQDLQSVKIGDFGLSLQFDNEASFHKTVSQRCGTYIYMAPEQIQKYQYSKPADIWSCGIILFMLLTMGKHPYYKALNSKESYAEFLQSSPTFEIPQNITKLICLNPFERYSAGQALLHPWITRRFTDEIPMNIEERISMFKKKVKFSELVKIIMMISFIKKKLLTNQEFIRQYREDLSPGKKVQQIKFQHKILINLTKSDSPQKKHYKNPDQFHFQTKKQRRESSQHSLHEKYYTSKTQHTLSSSQERVVSKSQLYCQQVINKYIEQKSLKASIKLPSISLKK